MRTGATLAALLFACSFCGGHEPAAPSGQDGSQGGGSRWQDLYTSYFGLAGQASCSQLKGSCHRATADLGVATSGFVCGTTSDECWQGMTQGQGGHPGQGGRPQGGPQSAAHYAPHEWFELPPSHRSRAIYSELQQLDAATSGRLQDVADQSAPVRTRKSGSAT